jgi:hypothetical protein
VKFGEFSWISRNSWETRDFYRQFEVHPGSLSGTTQAAAVEEICNLEVSPVSLGANTAFD